MKKMRWLGVLFGTALFVGILCQSDLSLVWDQVRSLKPWRFGIIVLFYGVIFWLDTLGWKFAMNHSAGGLVRWDRLFRARLAGEALNYVTPAAALGGEPVKAYILSKKYGVPLSDGMASVVVAKTTLAVSMLLFVLTGVVLTLLTQPIPPVVSSLVWTTFSVLALLMGLFMAVQFSRPFQRAAGFAQRFLPGWISSFLEKAKEWDRAILHYYRLSPERFFYSLTFHFLGWVAGVIEVYLIFHFLQAPVGWSTAWSVEALWVLLRSGAFMIPATLGASEGFLLLICVGMGLGAVSGLALALVRRARELLWMGLGLVEFSRG
ncbi:MAG: flippase-like domain-containing protein [Candidatus Omnitrophica bacterium]|nr:flippase-like domain-containing protein [Candidatus Omnitrophota bacterium]